MKTYRIARTDLVVSRIAYGCGELGGLGSPRPPIGPAHSKDAIAKYKADHSAEAIERFTQAPPSENTVRLAENLIKTAYDNGITLFDHADVYGFGKSEEVFGAVLKRSPGLRNSIVLQSKCGLRYGADLLSPRPGEPHRMDFSPEHIVRSTEGSLRRLGTDHLDLLLLHRPDALMEPEEVARAFDELHDSGKVRYFGVSNHTPSQIELLKKYLRYPLVVNQVQLGLAYCYLIADGIEANRDESTRITSGYTGVVGTLDYCRLHDIQVQAWAPLKGRDMVAAPPLLGPRENVPPEMRRAFDMLTRLAGRRNIAPSAIALAWLLRHPAGIVPIIGATTPEHLIDGCSADRVDLTREEWYALFIAACGISSLRMLGVLVPKEWE